MKTTNPLAALLARSPFRPLQEHMRVVERCALELPPLVDALVAGDPDTVGQRKTEIFRLEHEADELKNSIRSGLPSSLFMPVARRDVLDLLASQDAVADAAQDAAGLLAVPKLRMIPALATPLRDLTREVTAVASAARDMMERLDELVEVGFRGREADAVLEMIDEVSRRESVTDTMGSDLVEVLFDHEGEMGALSVVFWYKAVQTLGQVADEAENVGDRLRLLIAR